MSNLESICKKYDVVIKKPSNEPTSISVFLPGTLLDLKDYNSTVEVLVSKNQLVIGFLKLNPLTKTHDKMAENVVNVVKAVCALKDYSSLAGSKYNIIGHSLGGKVALMVAAKYDKDQVNVIMALDPVDDKPQELTYPKKSPKTNLGETKAIQIHLFQSELGGQFYVGIPPGVLCPGDRNATVIRDMYPEKITSFLINEKANHMSYLDTKTDEASVAARNSVHASIQEHIGT
jgi:hypothetical protein